ncbi:AarF/ABC1/UbiB kinase family protein [Leptospira ognonensis]|uniref:AarF/ABC1/UbiB kinase family protein n=1 Tax=Leptospira ognonensis TaxID=2484945 RepID=A0A4R9JWS1_9LEPT|nr:AarF/UbiB family protein [Leptospira ognonensis]TGL57480.1 AarF/ABC1/UbiB kinase family protein [Leptospira ognonensis]
MNQEFVQIKNGRSLLVYSFVIKTWFGYYLLSKLNRRFLSEANWEIRKKIFFKKKGREAKHIFFQLGGVYIKIGQFVSNLFHILPEEFLWELQELQDKVPPRPFPEIEGRWSQNFSVPLHEIFTNLNEVAHASASTAQVHIGFYKEKKVAIKILYNGIEEQAKSDLKTIKRVLWFFDHFILSISGKEVSSQLEEMISTELDLRNELRYLKRTKQAFIAEKDFVFPEPVSEFCTKSILVTEFIEGKKIYDFKPEELIAKKNPYLEKMIRAYLLMIFEFRFFHADPHPGNLIFLESGQLCFIDFGAVQEISGDETRLLEKLLLGAMRKDYHLMADTLYELGAVNDHLGKEELCKILKYSMDKLNHILLTTKNFRNLGWDTLKPGDDLRFLKEIQVSLKFLFKSLKLPPNFLSLHRVLALLLGNFSYLDPNRSLFEYAEKPFSQIVLKGSSLRKRWRDEGEEILASSLSLPKELYEFLYQLNRGEFVFQWTEDKKVGNKQLLLREQFTYGVLGSIFFYFGIYYAEKSWKEPSLLFYILAGIAFWSFARAAWSYQNKK